MNDHSTRPESLEIRRRFTAMTGEVDTDFCIHRMDEKESLNSCYSKGVFCWILIAVLFLLAELKRGFFLCGEGEIPPHRIPSLGCGCISVTFLLPLIARTSRSPLTYERNE
jgi:hypothetical protein